MGDLMHRESGECRKLREALEALPVDSGVGLRAEQWRAELPADEARHAAVCEGCRRALEEFAETRSALAAVKVHEAGPWFTARVMAAIAAKEREDEAQDSVWIYVRRLAPRLVAFSALLLVLGGGWALQQRNTDLTSTEHRGGDMVFDSSTAPTWYDDGLGAMNEVRP
jgi:hypothetical protein